MKTHHVLIAYVTVMAWGFFTLSAQHEVGRQQRETNLFLAKMYAVQVQSYSAQAQTISQHETK